MARLGSALALVAGLAACTGRVDPADYAKMPDDALCAAFGENEKAREIVKAELDKRQLIPAGDWTRIQHGDIAYGMHRCAVLAALHKPDTMAGGGAVEIWTFPSDRVVRFQNGAVSAISDFR